MHRFKNITQGFKTVTADTKGGGPALMVDVGPGETSLALDVNEATRAEYEKLGWFEISEATTLQGLDATKTVEDGSKEQDTASVEGNPVKPATAADIAASFSAAAGDDGLSPLPDVTTDEFDGKTDDELRAFITDRDSEKPHHARTRPWLLATARGQDPAAAAGQAEEAV